MGNHQLENFRLSGNALLCWIRHIKDTESLFLNSELLCGTLEKIMLENTASILSERSLRFGSAPDTLPVKSYGKSAFLGAASPFVSCSTQSRRYTLISFFGHALLRKELQVVSCAAQSTHVDWDKKIEYDLPKTIRARRTEHYFILAALVVVLAMKLGGPWFVKYEGPRSLMGLFHENFILITYSILTIFHSTILNSFIGLTLVKWHIHGSTTSQEILKEKNPDAVWKEQPMEHLSRWDLNLCTESTLALNSSWWQMSNSPTIDRIRSIKLWKLTHKDFRPAHVASGPLVLALWGQSEVLIVANDQPISASLRKTRGLNNPNIREYSSLWPWNGDNAYLLVDARNQNFSWICIDLKVGY